MPGVGGQSAGGHAPALKSLGTWSPAELAGGGGGELQSHSSSQAKGVVLAQGSHLAHQLSAAS